MYQLKSLKISRVSTVDKPDNPPAEIMLFKRKGKSMTKELTAEQLADLPEGVRKTIEDLAKRVEEAEKNTEASKEAEGLLAKIKGVFSKKEDEPEVEPLVKEDDTHAAAFATLQKQLKDAEKARKESDERVEKLEAQREKDQMIALAKSLPGNPDDTASELVKIKTSLGAEEFEAYVKRQKAVAEQLRVNKLLTQFGSDADNDSGLEGVEAQIDKHVQAIRKADPTLTKEVAESKFYETAEGRALQERYQEALEQRQREVS